MTENVMRFSAIRGIQAGRTFYVVMVPMKSVSRLFRFDDPELPADLKAQRMLNHSRVPAIARYIVDNPEDYVLSALSATMDGEFEFSPVGGSRSVGELSIELGASLVINDGQHRRAAIEAAIRERPFLGDETIAVVVYPDRGLRRSQQMFVDLNQHAVKPARSLRLLYDGRDPEVIATRSIIESIDAFRKLTDFERSSLPTAPGDCSLSGIHRANAVLAANGVGGDLRLPFWRAVVANMPDWLACASGGLAAADLRRDMIHAHGVAWEAIALAGAKLIEEQPSDWPEGLAALRCVDWSRSSVQVWEGAALVGGIINRSRASVHSTALIIHRALTEA